MVTYGSLEGLYPEEVVPNKRLNTTTFVPQQVIPLATFLRLGLGSNTLPGFFQTLFSHKRTVKVPDTWYQSLYNLSMTGLGNDSGDRGDREEREGGSGGNATAKEMGASQHPHDAPETQATPAEEPATGSGTRRLVRVERPGSRGTRMGVLGWPSSVGGSQPGAADSAGEKRGQPSNQAPEQAQMRPRLPNTPTGLSPYEPRTWGIHQREGGPCGVIASLQARAIKYLFYGEDPPVKVMESRTHFAPSQDVYRSALLSAVFDTLAQFFPDGKGVSLVLPADWNSDSPEQKCSNIIKEMDAFSVISLRDEEELREVLLSPGVVDLAFRTGRSSFIPCLVASVVLTRGTSVIINKDFDATGDTGLSAGSIFVNFNNCSQELVNLLLTGRASASLHDGEMDVGGLILKGILRPTPVGILTIFEFYNYLRVGDNAKYKIESPAFVLFNEAHYTCLFAATRKDGQEMLQMLRSRTSTPPESPPGSPAKQLDLIYYDSLDDQSELVRITVTLSGPITVGTEAEGASKSFVDNLLYSLFGQAIQSIDWNGTEPYQ